MRTDTPDSLSEAIIRRGMLPIMLLSCGLAAISGLFTYRRDTAEQRERLAYQVETMVTSLETEWVHGNYGKVAWQLQRRSEAEFVGLYSPDCRLLAAVPSNHALRAKDCLAANQAFRHSAVIAVKDPTGRIGTVVASKRPRLLPILLAIGAPILASFLIPVIVYFLALKKALGGELLDEIRAMVATDRVLPPKRYREFGPVYEALQEHERRNRSLSDRLKEQEFKAKLDHELGLQASQVAHDIRSPLAALFVAVEGASSLPPQQGDLLRKAAARIQDISVNLLRTYRRSMPESSRDTTTPPRPLLGATSLSASLSEFATELNTRCLMDKRIPPIFELPENEPTLHVLVDPSDLVRILSNLSNNALEASPKPIRITASLTPHGDSAEISISDSGPGIPPDVLPKLGQRGATFGKEGGNGLGLWHAKTTVESWGGRLEIESELGKGTTVRLILPRAEPPPIAQAENAGAAVLIDDDPLVRMNWTVAAKRAGKALKTYPDAAAFIKEAGDCARETPIYIDSDLGEGVKGEDAAKELLALGFTELHLATGHDPASFPPLPHIKAIQGKEPPWSSA